MKNKNDYGRPCRKRVGASINWSTAFGHLSLSFKELLKFNYLAAPGAFSKESIKDIKAYVRKALLMHRDWDHINAPVSSCANPET